MTGAGVARGATELGETAIEIRSVNGRNVGVKLRVPASCAGYEAHFDARVRTTLERGNVRIAIEVETATGDGESIVDLARARAAVAQLRHLAEELDLDDPDLEDVLAVPGVLASQGSTQGVVSREPPPQLDALFEQALAELVAHRTREGRATVDTVRALFAELSALRDDAIAGAPAAIAAYREKLLLRVNEFLEGKAKTLEPADVAREVALFADRADIAEELQRLGAHLVEAEAMLTAGGALGRKLEFLLQEVLREVNTLGSKSPDSKMAATVVAMKTAVERLREQAANLE